MNDRPTPRPRPRPRPKPRPSVKIDQEKETEGLNPSDSHVAAVEKPQFATSHHNQNMLLHDMYSHSSNPPTLVHNLDTGVFMSCNTNIQGTHPYKTTVNRKDYQPNEIAVPSSSRLNLNMADELVDLREKVFLSMHQGVSEDDFTETVKKLASFNYNVNEKYAYLSFKDLLLKNAVCINQYAFQKNFLKVFKSNLKLKDLKTVFRTLEIRVS